MREDHERRARLFPTEVVLQPCELIGTKLAETFESHHVHQPDKVNTFLVEAVPAASLRAFAIPLEIRLAVVRRSIVFARHVVYLSFYAAQHLIQSVEFRRVCPVRQIAGVEQELRLTLQGADLVDGGLQRYGYIGVGRFVEADMAV